VCQIHYKLMIFFKLKISKKTYNKMRKKSKHTIFKNIIFLKKIPQFVYNLILKIDILYVLEIYVS